MVEKNPFISKNSNPPVFSNSGFLFFFEKKHVSVLFSKNPTVSCFYCIMQYRHLQIHTLINCYSYYAILIWGKRNVHLSLFSQCWWPIHFKVASLARMRTANRKKPLPHSIFSANRDDIAITQFQKPVEKNDRTENGSVGKAIVFLCFHFYFRGFKPLFAVLRPQQLPVATWSVL